MPSKKHRAKAAKAATKQASPLPDIVRTIRDKWHEQTKAYGGWFIHFIDGNTANCSSVNLAYVNPYYAFKNPNWVVDWDMNLTEEEIQYVLAHMDNFATLYEMHKDKGAHPMA